MNGATPGSTNRDTPDYERLHPEARAVLTAARLAGRPPVYEQSLADARAHLVAATQTDSPIRCMSVVDEWIDLDAHRLAVRVYRPAGDEPLPMVVYLHGGCWIIGDLDTHDADCRSVASRAGCIVIAVHYRLAPEHPFPAATDDTYSAIVWASEQASRLGGDPNRLAVCGVSAGGNLAAAAAMMARDRSGPRLSAQALVYPITDCDLSRPSYLRYGNGFLLTTATMRWSWDLYAADQRELPLASPMRAASHAGLAPAFVLVAECDPLRDEGVAYAEVLAAAGVPVELVEVKGQVHAFFSSPGRSRSADAAHDLLATWLRRQWASTAETL